MPNQYLRNNFVYLLSKLSTENNIVNVYAFINSSTIYLKHI